jgi:hypothetical protein
MTSQTMFPLITPSTLSLSLSNSLSNPKGSRRQNNLLNAKDLGSPISRRLQEAQTFPWNFSYSLSLLAAQHLGGNQSRHGQKPDRGA